jgi:D-3-phosphoglycerate dehydrogenase
MDPSLTSELLVREISNYEILVVRSTRVTREVIAAGKSLSLIVRAGAGVDTIDIDAASEYGVRVANTPGCNADAVAELTFAHILACDRQIVGNTTHLQAGEWRKKLFLDCPGLKGRTLGLLGAGSVAQAVARIAKAFGMKVVIASLGFYPADAAQLGVEWAADSLELAQRSDVLSIHIFYSPESHHLCSKEFFGAMKPGATFINTSRGAVVDTEALVDALRTKNLKVGLDVYENEPAGGYGVFNQTELARLLASASAHVGGSTEQANEAIAAETVNVINTFVRTGEALHCVNIEREPQSDYVLTIRHRGVLSEIFQTITEKKAEVLTVNNQCLTGALSQTASIRIRGKVALETALQDVSGVLSVSVGSA